MCWSRACIRQEAIPPTQWEMCSAWPSWVAGFSTATMDTFCAKARCPLSTRCSSTSPLRVSAPRYVRRPSSSALPRHPVVASPRSPALLPCAGDSRRHRSRHSCHRRAPEGPSGFPRPTTPTLFDSPMRAIAPRVRTASGTRGTRTGATSTITSAAPTCISSWARTRTEAAPARRSFATTSSPTRYEVSARSLRQEVPTASAPAKAGTSAGPGRPGSIPHS